MKHVHDPGNRHPLDEVWLVVSVDDQGEGIVASGIPGIGMALMVTGDRDKAGVIWQLATAEPALAGKRLRLVRYVRVEVLAER